MQVWSASIHQAETAQTLPFMPDYDPHLQLVRQVMLALHTWLSVIALTKRRLLATEREGQDSPNLAHGQVGDLSPLLRDRRSRPEDVRAAKSI